MSQSDDYENEEQHDQHEKFEGRSLKVNLEGRRHGSVNVSAGGGISNGYVTAHTVGGGDRMQLFAIRKGESAQARFWLQMELDDAEAYANQILREVKRAKEENDE